VSPSLCMQEHDPPELMPPPLLPELEIDADMQKSDAMSNAMQCDWHAPLNSRCWEAMRSCARVTFDLITMSIETF
jgi:hypothetical protein